MVISVATSGLGVDLGSEWEEEAAVGAAACSAMSG